MAHPQLRDQVYALATARTRGERAYPAPLEAVQGLSGQPVWEKRMRYAPMEDVRCCKEYAKLFMLPEQEELFDNRAHGIAACEHATGVQKLVTVQGIRHYGIDQERRELAQRLAIDWFDHHLRGGPQRGEAE